MKIDYITNLRIPSTKANSIQVMQNCEAFKNAEIDISLTIPFRFGTKKEQKISDLWNYYGITNRFRINHLACLDLFPIGASRLSFFLQSLTFYISVFFRFLIKRTQVVYTRDVWTSIFLFYKKNKIIELHDFPTRNLSRSIFKFLLKRFAKIIVISKGLEQEVKKVLPNAKIIVAPDGVKRSLFDIDITRDEARKKLKLPSSGKIILYSGSLQKWKGVDVLLDAFEAIKDATLYVVGSSLDNSDLNMVKNSANVIFKGHIPYCDIPLYLRAADVLVIPNTGEKSISAKYTSPLKAFEYMVSGKPIVVSNLPSLMEIFSNKNSYIFKAGNSTDLACKIKESLADSSRAEHAYEDGIKYGWDVRVIKILDFIGIKE